MITLEGNSLTFRFPEVHEDAKTEIQFQRTLRIPDTGNCYPLPPWLGTFPLRHLEDFAHRVPEGWRERGGVIMPMYQAEAMWALFGDGWRFEGYPCAIKIAAGKINAISGKPWKPELDGSKRDYVVVPTQPWLDGFRIAKGVIRQFVAMPLGSGYSVEEQITGKPEHGGLQIIVYPMKRESYELIQRKREAWWPDDGERYALAGEQMLEASRCMIARSELRAAVRQRAPMALAAGGRMKQQIYADPYGLATWDQSVWSRCFVTLANAIQWCEFTDEAPPTKPPTAEDYTKAGLPWFDYYAVDLETLAGAPALALVKSVAEMAAEKGEQMETFGPDAGVNPGTVIDLGPAKPPRTEGRPVQQGKA